MTRDAAHEDGAGDGLRLPSVARIGARYGDGFQLIRELARGTRARVFLASDGRHVEAVKVHPVEHEHRAEREHRVGGALDHPNLVRVLGRVRIGDAPAVRMPYVAGVRLGDWARDADVGARLDLLDGLLAGLQALHEAGFVHRDVKPENVLRAHDGRAVLLDYDLAVAISDPRDARTTAGTPAYLSPEQARGEPAGPASDLYAAGVLLYRWLTGELPFVGRAEEVIASHRDAPVRAPSAFAAELAPFDALVARVLDKRPEARFSEAATLRAALRAARTT